jgi:hypothetical protein
LPLLKSEKILPDPSRARCENSHPIVGIEGSRSKNFVEFGGGIIGE